MLHDERYRAHWAEKEEWYKKNNLWDHVIVSQEVEGFDSNAVQALMVEHFGEIEPVTIASASGAPTSEPTPIVDEVTQLRALIAKGESSELEFKETLEVDTKTGNKLGTLVQSTLKTLAAYLNTNGGILLIGVANNGEIKGLGRDFRLLAKNQNPDGLELKLRDLVGAHFDPVPLGQVAIAFVSTPEGTVCRVHVTPSTDVIHYDNAVYVRDGNRTIKLEGRRLTEWVARRTRK